MKLKGAKLRFVDERKDALTKFTNGPIKPRLTTKRAPTPFPNSRERQKNKKKLPISQREESPNLNEVSTKRNILPKEGQRKTV